MIELRVQKDPAGHSAGGVAEGVLLGVADGVRVGEGEREREGVLDSVHTRMPLTTQPQHPEQA